jgi:hypothetical protein
MGYIVCARRGRDRLVSPLVSPSFSGRALCLQRSVDGSLRMTKRPDRVDVGSVGGAFSPTGRLTSHKGQHLRGMHRDRGRTPSKLGVATLFRRFGTRERLPTATFAAKMKAYTAIEDALHYRDPWHGFRVYIKRVCCDAGE